MKRFIGGFKDMISQKQPDENRDQGASSSSQTGPSRPVSSQPSWGDSKDEPPAYSTLDPAPSPAGPADSKDSLVPTPYIPERLQKYSNGEDPFAFLSFFDTIFVIDDSGSMAGKSWKEAADVLRTITPICTAHDKDGIDLYFLNHKSTNKTPDGKAPHGYYNIETPEEITEIFKTVQPNRGTPTGGRLRTILRPYVDGLPSPKDKSRNIDDVKPINIIVITDGEPTDDPDFVIAKYARDLDKLDAPVHQVGIQFFQVGNLDGAAEALQRLDNLFGPTSEVRDMVDTVSWDATPSKRFRSKTLSADTILKVVLGAVIRRLDKLPAVKEV
ncbi:hypothetical protein GGI35DRAFT_264535 [Trichoderma velutinum]